MRIAAVLLSLCISSQAFGQTPASPAKPTSPVKPATPATPATPASPATPTPATVPAAPDGWKYVESTDKSYQVLFPAVSAQAGSRERIFRNGRGSFKIATNYSQTADTMTYTVEALTLAGPNGRAMTLDDVLELFLEGQRKNGYKVSETTEVKAGALTAREYTATKTGTFLRSWVILGKPRTIALSVSCLDTDNTKTKNADTFLRSMLPTPEKAAAFRAEAAAAAAKAAANEPKPPADSPKWTLDLDEMTVLQAPVSGVVKGGVFKLDIAKLQNGSLSLRQGTGFWADKEVLISLLSNPGAGKSFSFSSKTKNGLLPHVSIARIPEGQKLPQNEVFFNRYALKLEFGQEEKGKIPGTIYLCTPDKAKSVVAGTFEVDAK